MEDAVRFIETPNPNDDLGRLITQALDGGATGVLVAGSTGEGALLTPAFARRGQRIRNRTRVPASNARYFPTRSGPGGRCPPSFATASS